VSGQQQRQGLAALGERVGFSGVEDQGGDAVIPFDEHPEGHRVCRADQCGEGADIGWQVQRLIREQIANADHGGGWRPAR
jgi:hypothetical protein